MTQKEIYFSGKKFISLKQASEKFGYARDYVGQLCREDKIGCERVGRTWFINYTDLLLYSSKRRKEVGSENSLSGESSSFKLKKVKKSFSNFGLNFLGVARVFGEKFQLFFSVGVEAFKKLFVKPQLDDWDRELLESKRLLGLSFDERGVGVVEGKSSILSSSDFHKNRLRKTFAFLGYMSVALFVFAFLRYPHQVEAAWDSWVQPAREKAALEVQGVASDIRKISVGFATKFTDVSTGARLGVRRGAVTLYNSTSVLGSGMLESVGGVVGAGEGIFEFGRGVKGGARIAGEIVMDGVGELKEVFGWKGTIARSDKDVKINSGVQIKILIVDAGEGIAGFGQNIKEAVGITSEVMLNGANTVKDIAGGTAKKFIFWTQRGEESKEFVEEDKNIAPPLVQENNDIDGRQTDEAKDNDESIDLFVGRQQVNIEKEIQFLKVELANIKRQGLVIEGPVVQKTIIEKTIERVLAGLSDEEIETRIQQVNNRLMTQIANVKNMLADSTTATYRVISLTNKIDTLDNTSMNTPTITSPTVAGTMSAAAASFSGAVSVSGILTAGVTALNGVTYTWPSSGGSSGQVLSTDGAGILSWATASGGSSSSSGAWASSTDLAFYPVDTTDVVIIGSSATTSTGNIFEVIGNSLFDDVIFANSTSTNATSTTLYSASSFGLGSDYISDITGSGLSVTGGALTVDTSSLLSFSDWLATTTDALSEGSSNLYWTTDRFDTRLAATTTLPNLTTLLGLTNTITTNATTTNATTTSLYSSTFGINSEYFTDLTGAGLSISSGALTLNATGDWTGTIDGNNFAGGAVATGDLLYGSGAGTISELSASTNGYILSLSGGIPAWIATTTFIMEDELNTFSELNALVSDQTLVNLASINAWTGLNTFTNASSTLFSVFNTLYVGGTATTSITGDTSTSTFAGGIAINGALDVQSSTATSTFANGINVATGCFSVNGTCVGGGGGAWTSSGGYTILDTSSDNIGINNSSPDRKLFVQGTEITSGFTGTNKGVLYVGGGGFNAGDIVAIDFGSSTFAPALARIGANLTNNGSYLRFGTSNSYADGITNTAMTISYAGYVGIGTESPLEMLHVGSGADASSDVDVDFIVQENGAVGMSARDATNNVETVLKASAAGGQIGTVTNHDLTIIANNTEWMRIDSAGNIGIGTTSPYAKLSVVGETVSAYFTATTSATSTFAGGIQSNLLNITSSTATSTFANGLDLSAGCFSVNGTCVGGGGGSGTVGSGTIGQTPYYAGSGTTLTATSSLYIDTNSNVGIGTTSPDSVLTVVGEGTISAVDNLISISNTVNDASMSGTGVGIAANQWYYDASSPASSPLFLLDGRVESNWTSTASTRDATFRVQTALDGVLGEVFSIGSSGNVAYKKTTKFGIGSSASPSASLLNIAGAPTTIDGIGTHFHMFDTSSAAQDTGPVITFYGNTDGVGTRDNFAAIRGGKENGTAANGQGYLSFFTSDANEDIVEVGRFSSAGNFGIGTTSPYAKLSVAGETVSAYFTATTSATSTFAGGIQSNLLNITSSTATSTFANGLDLSAGCFSVNGTCVTGGGGSSLWTDGGATSYLTAVGDNVGIGTSTAYAKLSIWGGGIGTGKTFEVANNASTTLFSILDNGTITMGAASAGNILFDTVASSSNTVLVGMGTTTPDADLTILSNSPTSNTYIFTIATSTDGSDVIDRKFIVDTDGDVHYDGSLIAGADYAEAFNVIGDKSNYEPGDIVVLSDSDYGSVEKTNSPYQSRIVGVYSTKPGIIGVLAEDHTDYEITEENDIPVGMLGRVPVKVSLEGGEINAGDRITSSSEPGIGMKATTSGMTIGTALESYSASSAGDMVLVLLDTKYSRLTVVDGVVVENENVELRVDNLELRIEELENRISAQIVSSDVNIISEGFDWIIGQFKSIGVSISNGIIQAKEFIADKITAKKAVLDALEMTDSVTGETYCVRISNGEWSKFKGTCGEAPSSEPTPTPTPQPILGCTDTTADNYNVEATEDDGSCIAEPTPEPVLGCTDITADNYNTEATEDDGTCTFPEPTPQPILGCTDTTADNYNVEATEDDGSCIVPEPTPEPILGCMDSTADNYNTEATEGDGSCVFPDSQVLGCTDTTANNYNTEATEDDGTCTFPEPTPEPTPEPVLGCTDTTADNYNVDAMEDDGSCIAEPIPEPEA